MQGAYKGIGKPMGIIALDQIMYRYAFCHTDAVLSENSFKLRLKGFWAEIFFCYGESVFFINGLCDIFAYVRSSIVTEQVVQFIVIQQVFIELEIIVIAVGDHSFERFHCYFLEAYIHALKLYKWKEVLYIGFHVGFNVCHHYPYGRLIFYGAWYKGAASVGHGACHFIELVYKLVFLIKECIVLFFISSISAL